jgi:apolipoprotein D and lipocalin family protein
MRLNPTTTRLCSIVVALLMTACTYLPEGVQPVRGFDVSRYMGTWYEVARLPNRFERGLERVTATYSLQDDGSVRVVNRGYDIARQEWRDIAGRARFVGEPDVAALKVSFFGPFYGGYNVIDLDPEYRYALVVGSDRSYLWILSREPNLSTEVIERLKRKAAELGFDTRPMVYVQHSG